MKRINFSNSTVIFIFLIFNVFLFCALTSFNSQFEIYFGFFFILTLFFFIFISSQNSLSLLFSLSIFLYFYQVPLVGFFPKVEGVYFNYYLSNGLKVKLFFINSNILVCFYILIKYLINNSKNWNLFLEKDRSSILLKAIYFSSFFIVLIFLFLTIRNAGGIQEYLELNKFEASESQKTSFFTHKDFYIFFLISGFFIKRDRKFEFLCLVFLVMFFEILSSKRFLLLITAVYYFLFYVKKLNFKVFVWSIIALGFGIFSKFIYYSFKAYLLNSINFSEVFWFQWEDILKEFVLIHETRAHIELLINYLYFNVNFEVYYLIKQFVVSIPFGHVLVPDYKSAGAFLQNYLNEPWSGLASSQYIVPFLSIGLTGIYFIYSVHYLLLKILFWGLKLNNDYISLYLSSLFGLIFFYSQREEIVVIFKAIFINFSVLLLILLTANLWLILRNLIKNAKSFLSHD
jgi:hypothetical protein